MWVIGAILYHLNLCFSLPWVNGIVTVALLGISAGIIADILKQSFYSLFCLIFSVMVYFVIMRLSLIVTGQTLNAYKGIDTMGSLELSRIPQILDLIRANFFGIFLNNNLELSYNLVTKAMYLLLFLTVTFFVVTQLMHLIRTKDILKSIVFNN